MLISELIKKKRDGGVLKPDEIRFLLHQYVSGEMPDYQMSALLMSIFFRGLTTEELVVWTEAMIASGETLSFDESAPCLDKHSTGGVGDKVSLPLAPILACLGIRVPMISGRGLGHTGGTLDKLESIPGLSTALTTEAFRKVVERVGCCIAGQTAKLVPADKLLYALRDVTATVDSIPLISSSILSKKKASGISGLLVDVKTGSGAFMKTRERARALAENLVSLGRGLGLSVKGFITEMGSPLGAKVGNTLEVLESIEVLRGSGPADTTELVTTFATEMLLMSGLEGDRQQAEGKVKEAVSSGAALERFARMVEAQGGDPRIVEKPESLPSARYREVITADRSGWVSEIDCEAMGYAVVALGGGRRKIEDAVNPRVGLEVHVKVGGEVVRGDRLVTVHYDDPSTLPEAIAILTAAYRVDEAEVSAPPLIHEVVTGN